MAQRALSATLRRRWCGVVVSASAVALVSGAIMLAHPRVPLPYLLVLYVLVVMGVAIVWGTAVAVVTAMLSTVVINWLFIHPLARFDDPSILIGSVAYLVTAVVVGRLAARLRKAALESAKLSEQQAALRRIATLVARSAPPPEVFTAVTREVGVLCGADLARMERYEEDGSVTGIAAWSRVPVQLSVGTRFELVGPSIARDVYAGGKPVRVDSFTGAAGDIAKEAQEIGIRSSVGCPIMVAGQLWGVIAASTKNASPFPADTESRIGDFTELVATAVANADSSAELAASRARVVAAADESRRRFERNLHDGAQQRLVALALNLRATLDDVPHELPAIRGELERAINELAESLNDLREISRGLHPTVLSRGGLGLALRSLARRCPIPVELHVGCVGRYEPSSEIAAYYVVSEALTNVAKHAAASTVKVSLDEHGDQIQLCVRDDGVGGVDPRRGGSGLVGLRDRIEALGGSIDVISPPGGGTTIKAFLPSGGHARVPRSVGDQAIGTKSNA
jgi:signal transduction histidine kinase